MQKLAGTSKKNENETKTFAFSYISDWFLKTDFEKMKHGK